MDSWYKVSSYCCWQVTAFVSTCPSQATDNIKHLELELQEGKKEKERMLQMASIELQD